VYKSTAVDTLIKIRLCRRKMNYYGQGTTVRVCAQRHMTDQTIVRYSQIDKERDSDVRHCPPTSSRRTGRTLTELIDHLHTMDAKRIEAVEVTWPPSRHAHMYARRLGMLSIFHEAECIPSPPLAATN
jgi:hypothetical protein